MEYIFHDLNVRSIKTFNSFINYRVYVNYDDIVF